jgi:hypothetical protein
LFGSIRRTNQPMDFVATLGLPLSVVGLKSESALSSATFRLLFTVSNNVATPRWRPQGE